jgi:hypothetical protein
MQSQVKRLPTGQVGGVNPIHTRKSKKLEAFERAYNCESIIQESTKILVDSLVSTLGEIEHVDSEIQEFCRYNIARQENLYNVDLINKLKEVCHVTLCSGFSVTEPLYEEENGLAYTQDYICYPSKDIVIKTNSKGRLTEGETTIAGDSYKSGIYQVNNSIHTFRDSDRIRLPLDKVALVTYGMKHNNYYGQSIVQNCYRWHIVKESLVEMMLATLDRYGNPLVLYTVPRIPSGTTRSVLNEDNVPEEKDIGLPQRLIDQLSDPIQVGYSNSIVLPFDEGDKRPQGQVLSGNNNFGSSFLDGINLCDLQMSRHILTNLFGVSGGSSLVQESQTEILDRVIASLYRVLIVPFVKQTLHRQVQYNFAGRESANIPPKFQRRKSPTPELQVALMQVIRGLTELGYLNPLNSSDWSAVRDKIDALDRPMDKEDRKFINDVFVSPKAKPVGASPTMGRPVGKSSPLQTARPVTKTKPIGRVP